MIKEKLNIVIMNFLQIKLRTKFQQLAQSTANNNIYKKNIMYM